METPLLIRKSDFEGRIDLSVNLDAARKLNQHIRHATDFDLCELMGDRFFYGFLATFDETGTQKIDTPQLYKDLYSGSTYAVKGITYPNPGLKPVLVYFTGARLVKKLDEHITPNGFRDKVNEYSEQVGSGRRAFASNEYENQATAYWRKVETFISHNRAFFSDFYHGECGDTRGGNRARPKTVAVGASNRIVLHNRRRFTL